MDNMFVYNQSKACPDNALKPILGGKLKGKSDINPMWRIKQLTTLFGPCGVGWKPCNVKYWTEPGAEGEVSAWCSLELKIKVEGQWSDGIEGVGGSMLVEKEKGKLVTNDEAFKMAQTDALSVCCKLLGFAADVYWENDRTKYSRQAGEEEPAPSQFQRANTMPPDPIHYCEDCTLPIRPFRKGDGTLISPAEWAANTKALYDRQLCRDCQKKAEASRVGTTA